MKNKGLVSIDDYTKEGFFALQIHDIGNKKERESRYFPDSLSDQNILKFKPKNVF